MFRRNILILSIIFNTLVLEITVKMLLYLNIHAKFIDSNTERNVVYTHSKYNKKKQKVEEANSQNITYKQRLKKNRDRRNAASGFFSNFLYIFLLFPLLQKPESCSLFLKKGNSNKTGFHKTKARCRCNVIYIYVYKYGLYCIIHTL